MMLTMIVIQCAVLALLVRHHHRLSSASRLFLAPAQNGDAVRLPSNDTQMREFKQFVMFQTMMKNQPEGTKQQPDVPASLANVGYVRAEQLNGYLSKQFPTIGNPAPLGLFAFSLTAFVWCMHLVGASVNTTGPQTIVVGLAIFYGGIVQFAAGMWELRVGNTFGAVAFASYGGFWMSFAAISIPFFGVTFDPATQGASIGIYLFS
jgi:hypothetical protein